MYSGFSSPMALANSRIFSTPTQKASSYGKALPTYSRFSAIRWGRLASFLVLAVAPAVRAKLFDLQPIRVVAPVLAGDVVAALTLFARQGDLGADVGGGHGSCLFLDCRCSDGRLGFAVRVGLPPFGGHLADTGGAG